MRFKTLSSPHLPPSNAVHRVMRHVAIGLLPGTAAMTWFFGWGVLFNLASCVIFAYAIEAVMLTIRNRPVCHFLADNSALVTGCLLGLALPPFAPWWIALIGMAAALILGKHLYGGLGYNPFNPAMVGYVTLLISFPVPMSTLWANSGFFAQHSMNFLDSLSWYVLTPDNLRPVIDTLTGASPLDVVKTQLKAAFVLHDVYSSTVFGVLAGAGWEWVNLGFLVGGIWLWRKGIIQWRIPVAVLVGLCGMALLFYLSDPSIHPSPLFHALSGATMLGAFFIATDPVSAATTPRGRLIYGLGIGIMTYLIRTWGGYPDAFAFAVLLMNMAAPAIDHCTRPRVFGHGAE